MKNNGNNKSKKRLRLLDYNRDGKGVSKSKADMGHGIKRFFVSFKDNFTKILYVNIFMVLGNFPLIFLIAAFSGVTKVESYVPMSDVFQNLASYFATEAAGPSSMALFGITGIQSQTLVPTAWTYVFYAIGGCVIFTFGLVNVGCAYILRNIARGEPVFVWSDFWYAVKKNWKQAFPFGIVDVLINALLIMNIYNMFVTGTPDFMTSFMFWASIVLFIVYFVMRYYIYIQMVTFKLSVLKILKNSLIFAILGFKRNFMATLGILAVMLIEFLCIFSSLGSFLIPIAVAIPLCIGFSLMAYMKVYAAYYKMKEVMIDPYYKDPESDTEKRSYSDDDEDDVIMHDDVSERERLDEIKKRNGMIE